MKNTNIALSSILIASLLVACADDPCASTDTVVPGVGVGIGEDAVCLGQTRAEVEAVLGAGEPA